MARSVSVARLFFDIEANTKGLDNQLTQAEKSLGRTATFVQKNLVVAAGAAGVALVGIGIRATQMAGEVDAAFRTVANAVPGAVDRLNDLKEAGRDLSTEFGLSQLEVAKIMEEVARTGVDSADTLITASRAAVRAQRATGEEFSGIINLIDSALDVFGVSAENVDAILAKLIATAKGKVSLTELAATFERLAPAARAAGLDMETLGAAVITLRNRGETSRQAITTLNDTLKQTGAEGVRQLAEESRVATDGMAELEEQINTANTSIENQAKIIRERLNAQLIDLGNRLLPHVIAGLRHVANLMDILTGAPQAIEQGAMVATISNLSKVLDKLSPERKAEELKRLTASMRDLVDAPGGLLRNPFQAIELGLANVGKLSRTELEAMRSGLEAASRSGLVNKTSLEAIERALVKVNGELGKRPAIVKPGEVEQAGALVNRLDQIKELAAGGASLDQIIAKLGTLSEVEKTVATEAIKAAKDRSKARADEAKEAEKAAKEYEDAMARIRKATVAASATLTDDLELALEELAKDLSAAGVSAEDAARGLKPLQDELKLLRVTERIKLPELLEKSAKALTQFDIKRLQSARAELLLLSTQVTAGSKTEKEIKDQIKEVEDKILEATASRLEKQIEVIRAAERERQRLNDVGNAAKGVTTETDKTKNNVTETAGKIISIAQGALGVLQLFGDLSDESALILQNIIATADNFSKLAESGFANPAALIGAVGSLAGVLNSIFGDSPQEKARQALVKRNTDALEELTRGVVDLARIQAPGRQIEDIRSALQAVFERTTGAAIDPRVLTEELLKRGLTQSDLQKFAKDLGFDLGASGRAISGLQALLDFLNTANFGFFADTFQGSLDRIAEGLRNGAIRLEEEFGFLLRAIGKAGGAPAIQQALEGLDLGTVEGRGAALENLRELFRDLTTGQFTPEQLAEITGGLGSQEFLEVLNRLIAILADTERVIDPVVGPDPFDRPELDTATANFYSASLDRASEQTSVLADHLTVAERQASTLEESLVKFGSLESLAAQQLARLEELARAPRIAPIGINPSRAVDDLLAGLSGLSPVQPPALPPSILSPASTLQGAAAGARSVSVGSLTVQVNGTLNGDPKLAGEIAGREALRVINEGLGDDFHLQQLLAGKAHIGGIIQR